jgi:hypothetical protein
VYKKIVIKAFEKAEEEINGKVSRNSIAKKISEELLSEFHYSVSSRWLIDIYKDSVQCEEGKDVSIKSEHLEKLCSYLGFKDYQDYLQINAPDLRVDDDKTSSTLTGLQKALIGLILSTFIVISAFYFLNRERWMLWDRDHYKEVSFEAKKVQSGDLKVYKVERIEYFKKINTDCNTSFFSEDQNVKIWYGKNFEGVLEYFTDLGKHPVTGKTLKPITVYMIRKHVCDTY